MEGTIAASANGTENMVTGTTQELAIKMGCDYTTALQVLKYLATKGIVRNAGTRPAARGKGKGSMLFSVPVGVVSLCVINS